MVTARPHRALGIQLAYLEECNAGADDSKFRAYAESGKPCVIRGLAAEWPHVEQGRFDPKTTSELRRRLGSRDCNVSFEPGKMLFNFDVPPSWEASESSTESTPGASPKPRLVNPGRLAMSFSSFLEACEWKHQGPNGCSRIARVSNALYDDEDSPSFIQKSSANQIDVSLDILAKLALYCVQDAGEWPDDLLELFVPHDPSRDIMPEWMSLLQERRIWMSAGGPDGVAHVTAGFHWDHMENIHVVLSGKKEVFLLPPVEAPALHATRFCKQAQWQVEASSIGGASANVILQPMESEESSSDYAIVGIDEDFEVNSKRSLALSELQTHPLWAVLKPGDAIFIPAGWWHSIRTWRPPRDEHGVPFSLSVNFWYKLSQFAFSARRSELIMLQILSCQHALSGSPKHHLENFLRKLEAEGCNQSITNELRARLQGSFSSKDKQFQQPCGDNQDTEFVVVD